jgi:cyclopropane fatty-acyl-phospholipid synthase-like methyltransferase
VTTNQATSAEAVSRYYDKVQWLYSLGWSAGGTRSLHYGLWWKDTRKLADAIINGDRFIAEKLEVKPGDHVLDMGCGVGGSSIYFAKQYGCRVTGITVSKVQLSKAIENARSAGVSDLVSFELRDYTRTGFAAQTFTKAFTQESSNYALHKIDLLNEAYRVLKPGGRYVSLDPYLKRDIRPGIEAERVRRVTRGWGCPGLERFDRYLELAEQAGLKLIEKGDVNDHGLKSARIIWWSHIAFFPPVYLARKLGLVPRELLWHFQSSIYQKDMHCAKDNLLMFGYLVADKPGPKG